MAPHQVKNLYDTDGKTRHEIQEVSTGSKRKQAAAGKDALEQDLPHKSEQCDCRLFN
jgi:hypothetical protein